MVRVVCLAQVGPAVRVCLPSPPLAGVTGHSGGVVGGYGRLQAWWQGCERCLGSELRNWGRQGGLGDSSGLQSGVMLPVTIGVSG